MDLRSNTELGKDEHIHGDIYEGFVNVGGGKYGATGVWEGPAWDEAILEESIGGLLEGTSPAKVVEKEIGEGPRRRYFISLIDESIYKKGVFQRLRRRHKVRALSTLFLLLLLLLESVLGCGGAPVAEVVGYVFD